MVLVVHPVHHATCCVSSASCCLALLTWLHGFRNVAGCAGHVAERLRQHDLGLRRPLGLALLMRQPCKALNWNYMLQSLCT